GDASAPSGGDGCARALGRIREDRNPGHNGWRLHGDPGAAARKRAKGAGRILTEKAPNSSVSLRYAVAALASAAGAVAIGGWGWLLMWLAVSLGAQAAAYAGWGTAVFQKKDGRLPWRVRILLAPYMICARITLHYYCRGLAPYAEAAPGV